MDQGEHSQAISSSLASGHTTASVALKRLVACSAKNRFYRANRDLGRVFKTEFLLSYLSEPQLRARIRRGLLKVEQLHALARDVYSGRRGRINARELHEQMNSCSCLTLILACIIYWQAKQITQTVPSGAAAEEGIDATPAPTRQPDRMGQRHSLRPVRPRSRPGPLATDSYVVFLQQSGRYPITEHDVSCSDTDRQPAYSRMANSRRRDGVLSQSSILGQNLENGHRIINNLQTPKPMKKQIIDRARTARGATQTCRLLATATTYEGLSRIGAAKFGSIDQETLLNWTYRFNKESLEGLINPKTEEKAE